MNALALYPTFAERDRFRGRLQVERDAVLQHETADISPRAMRGNSFSEIVLVNMTEADLAPELRETLSRTLVTTGGKFRSHPMQEV